jgi:dipeptidyl aminopeptidase/acylaminoacyl peptidase
MRRITRFAILGLAGAGIGSVIATENALYVDPRPSAEPQQADQLAQETGSSWEPAAVDTADGVTLRGWLFRPAEPNGGAAMLLHGVGDTRLGMMQQARLLLDAGYSVLLPDARGHGNSGGRVISYGLRESLDVHCWAGWLLARVPNARLYGLGASMGAAVLLQSLMVEHRFRAVVAECPFATFQEIALDRMHQRTGAPRTLFFPILLLSFVYARARYGLNMRHVSPAVAVRATTVPILLIHGTADSNIPVSHSRDLHALNASTRLWEVAGAGHVDNYAAQPEAYRKHVLEWFAAHL